MAGAVEYLYQHGGHFVLCRGKKPIWPRWNKRRPGLDTVKAHGPEIGLIPWSVGTSALDVDYGDIGELVEAAPPLVTLVSPRGAHAYYEDTEGRDNGHFEAHGCRGDVRSAKGFLRLYQGGADRLAGALKVTPQGTTNFPSDLFEAAGVSAPQTLLVEGPRRFNVRIPEALPALSTVREGHRNIALFNHVRFWAYGQDKGRCPALWNARVARIAGACNQLFAQPLPDAEVRKLAYSVSTWTWNGGGPIDHSPAAQQRRGVKSGRVRRAAVAKRDAAILADRAAAMTQAAIAARYGVTQARVSQILARKI